MIRAVFYRDSDGSYVGFSCRGHADYGKHGNDIVCAAVSALVINTINSVERFTDVPMKTKEDQESGTLTMRLSRTTEETQLLMRSLKLGLESIEQEHSKHIRIGCKEVQDHDADEPAVLLS